MRFVRWQVLAASAALTISACGRLAAPPGGASFAAANTRSTRPEVRKVYQPLAVGDTWTYTCNHEFKIVDRVVGTHRINGHTTYALSLQIPSSPSKSRFVVQLLANDGRGDTWIYGYLIDGKVRPVKRTEIVAASPVKNKHYDYPAPDRGTIERVFKGFEFTNKTPLGTFWVAPYFESGGTHNYGYNLGRGVMEEDHGPNYKYDCLIEKIVLH